MVKTYALLAFRAVAYGYVALSMLGTTVLLAYLLRYRSVRNLFTYVYDIVVNCNM